MLILCPLHQRRQFLNQYADQDPDLTLHEDLPEPSDEGEVLQDSEGVLWLLLGERVVLDVEDERERAAAAVAGHKGGAGQLIEAAMPGRSGTLTSVTLASSRE